MKFLIDECLRDRLEPGGGTALWLVDIRTLVAIYWFCSPQVWDGLMRTERRSPQVCDGLICQIRAFRAFWPT